MINPENIYQILLKEVTKITNVTNSTACLILDNVFQKGTLPKSFKQYQNQIDKRVRYPSPHPSNPLESSFSTKWTT